MREITEQIKFIGNPFYDHFCGLEMEVQRWKQNIQERR